jgi:hypothetical protein
MSILKSILSIFKKDPVIVEEVPVSIVETPQVKPVEVKKIPSGELSLDQIQDVWHSFTGEERTAIIELNKGSSFYNTSVESDPVQFYHFLRAINYPTI